MHYWAKMGLLNPTGRYLFSINNENTTKTLVFTILVSSLYTLSMCLPPSKSASIEP